MDADTKKQFASLAKLITTTSSQLEKRMEAKLNVLGKKMDVKIERVLDTVVTKEEVSALEKKVDANIERLLDVVATKEDIRHIETRQDELAEQMAFVVRANDDVATPVEELRLEYAAVSQQLTGQEVRIQRLEAGRP